MNASDFFGSFICRSKPCPQSFVWGAEHCNEDINRRLLWTNGGFSCTGILCDWNRVEDLKRIESPTLLVVGDHDIVAPADVRAMADKMPRATFVGFRNSGHGSWIDASSAFKAHFSAWIDQAILGK